MNSSSSQAGRLVEAIYAALVGARNSRQLAAPFQVVKLSFNPSGSVLVHLLPMGIFGPYLQRQIPHDLVADVKKQAGVNASKRRARKVLPGAVPAQMSLSELLRSVPPASGSSPKEFSRAEQPR